jgi:hypothetical protein
VGAPFAVAPEPKLIPNNGLGAGAASVREVREHKKMTEKENILERQRRTKGLRRL